LALIAGLLIGGFDSGRCEWQTFTTELGYGQDEVEHIFQDRDEALWFATEEVGVFRYDGSSWLRFSTVDGLASDVVWATYQDRLGTFWFATDAGVSRYNGRAWTTFDSEHGLPSDRARAIVEDEAGDVWVATLGGAARYDGATWHAFLNGEVLLSLIRDRAGDLWFGTAGRGAVRYDGTTWTTFLEGEYVLAIKESDGGDLWFGLSSGAVRYDGVTWQTFTTSDGLSHGTVRSIDTDRWGRVWFATHGGGVSRYDGDTWRTFTTADGLAHDEVAAVFVDASGNVWLASAAGVNRYDGANWRSFTTADGLVDDFVRAAVQDRSGNIWFASARDFGSGGVSRYDGENWTTFTSVDGLASDAVYAAVLDSAGALWFGTSAGASRHDGVTWESFPIGSVTCAMVDAAGEVWLGTEGNGASRYDGVGWRTFTTTDGLAGNDVRAIVEDRSGNIWFGTGLHGVSRFDGQSWTTFLDELLCGRYVHAAFVDESESVWFGCQSGISRYDGEGWQSFSVPDGVSTDFDHVYAIGQGQPGSLWFGTSNDGVLHYDGGRWWMFKSDAGLVGNDVRAILHDRSGSLWFATSSGVSRYEPDRAASQTLFVSRPLVLSSSRTASAAVAAAFGEHVAVEFSWRLDGGGWSDWSPSYDWFRTDLADGVHRLEVRSRDFLSNVDPTPAVAVFEVDATPPAPILTIPAFGDAVRGSFGIVGTADDARFRAYAVQVRASGQSSWDPAEILAASTSPVRDGLLATWNTESLPEGRYDLRVAVEDTLGLSGTAHVTVLVDNHPPWADETSPARVNTLDGGNVYSILGEMHLYFPPRAFPEDDRVSIEPLVSASVPETLPSGATRVATGFEIAWNADVLEKPATLDVSYANAGDAVVPEQLAFFRSSDGTTWSRLGGTVDAIARRLSATTTEPGRYAIFAESGVALDGGGLTSISFTPRVFSPTGTFASTEVGIGFHLGRPASVTVKVYTRSGRFVREVVGGKAMNAGDNLVRWDGRDRDGRFVADDLYIVTVEALGEMQKKTLAVVR
jgi:ligand-binding sensor domain-containing protein